MPKEPIFKAAFKVTKVQITKKTKALGLLEGKF